MQTLCKFRVRQIQLCFLELSGIFSPQLFLPLGEVECTDAELMDTNGLAAFPEALQDVLASDSATHQLSELGPAA